MLIFVLEVGGRRKYVDVYFSDIRSCVPPLFHLTLNCVYSCVIGIIYSFNV
jgi:hypothetical protein